MVKNKTLYRVIGNILFVGLLVGTLPAPLPLHAQGLAKLTKAQINEEIKSIKKTVRKLQIANVVIPGLIITAGATVFLVAFGFMLIYKRKISKLTLTIVEAPPEKLFDPKKMSTLKGKRIISTLVAIAAMVAAPIVAALAFIGIGGGTLVEAFDRAERLERMEQDHPGTLTHKQKLEIARLKNLYKGPIIRGIIKYFRMKKALKVIANKAIEKKPMLVISVGGGKKKKARKIIAAYIKAKWKTITLQRSVDEVAQRSTKAKLKWNISYKISKSKLKKAQKKVAKFEKRYPTLKTLQATVLEYEKRISEILEGVPEEIIKPEKPKVPLVVPL